MFAVLLVSAGVAYAQSRYPGGQHEPAWDIYFGSATYDIGNTLVGGSAAIRTASAAIESNGNTNPSLLKKRCRGLGGVKHRIGNGNSIISL